MQGSSRMVGGKNVLLVEDNVVNQMVAKQFLTRWGLSVTVANHGKEALELIHQKRYHLILMDLQMPEMDGYEATRYIRSLPSSYYQVVPIIAFSATEITDAKNKIQQSGMNDFLTKPFDPTEMQNKITRYIMESPSDEDHRPLNLALEAYAEDPDFKLSLVALIMANLTELQQAVLKSYASKEVQPFKTVAHKVKSSLVLLNDAEFTELTEQLTQDFAIPHSVTAADNVKHFNYLSERIMKSLQRETELLKAS